MNSARSRSTGMGKGRYFFVLTLCALFLVLRAAGQPVGFDHDEDSHFRTVLDIRRLGGLPPKELFPAIVFAPGMNDLAYHYLPPSPYLFIAGITALAGAEPDESGIVGWARASGVLAAIASLALAGLATRRMAGADRGWETAAFVTAGLALMPEFHSMAASFTSDNFGTLAIVALLAACVWAHEAGWSVRSTAGVAAAAAFLFAMRTTAYPSLLLVPASLAASPGPPLGRLMRFAAIGLALLGVNAWWLARNYAISGDAIGATAHAQHLFASGFTALTAEYRIWREAASGPVPELSLLVRSVWPLVQQTRMLLTARTWISPPALAAWGFFIVIPSVLLAGSWILRRARRDPWSASMMVAASVASALAFLFSLQISAGYGAFAVGKYMFMNTIPLVIVVCAALGAEDRPLWRRFRWVGLAFAAGLTLAYLTAILP